MDALNINNLMISSLSRDSRASIKPYTLVGVADDADKDLKVNKVGQWWSLGDYSNLMISIPFCDSENFMGGISTAGTVQIESSGERRLVANGVDIPFRATAIYFEDALLKIRAVNPN